MENEAQRRAWATLNKLSGGGTVFAGSLSGGYSLLRSFDSFCARSGSLLIAHGEISSL